MHSSPSLSQSLLALKHLYTFSNALVTPALESLALKHFSSGCICIFIECSAFLCQISQVAIIRATHHRHLELLRRLKSWSLEGSHITQLNLVSFHPWAFVPIAESSLRIPAGTMSIDVDDTTQDSIAYRSRLAHCSECASSFAHCCSNTFDRDTLWIAATHIYRQWRGDSIRAYNRLL